MGVINELSIEKLYCIRNLMNDAIGEIEDEDIELTEVINKRAARTVSDTAAFIEILRILDEAEENTVLGDVKGKIAAICRERLAE